MASNHFKKSFYTSSCVWLCMENKIFWKSISLDRKIKVLTWKLFYVSIFTTNYFRTQTHKERERERERRERRESRELSTSHNQTRRRDRAPTPDLPVRLHRRLHSAKIIPLRLRHRLCAAEIVLPISHRRLRAT